MVKLGSKYSFYTLSVIVIILSALSIRFYNFNNRFTFGPEQAISLITAGDYLKTKFSLLGQANLIRFTSDGHVLYSSPLFNYSLLPLMFVFNYGVVGISAYFVILNVFTGVLLYWLVKKYLDKNIAFISLFLFLFNNYMIYHSLFIWILNYLPIISVLSMYFINKYNKQKNYSSVIWLGVLSGVGFGMEYFYIITALLILLFMILVSKNKLKDTALYIFGILIGNLPIFLFDVRHNFYNINTFFKYILETISNPGQTQISYYHFLNFWPPMIILIAYFLNKWFIKKKIILFFILCLYVIVNINSNKINFRQATGMVPDLNYSMVYKASEVIAKDKPEKYNVVTLLDFDTRGHILRYPLKFIFDTSPLGVEDYKDASIIYALASNDYDFTNPMVWELQTFSPYKTLVLNKLNSKYWVYKLTK